MEPIIVARITGVVTLVSVILSDFESSVVEGHMPEDVALEHDAGEGIAWSGRSPRQRSSTEP